MTKKGEVKSTSKSVGKLTDKQKRFVEEYLIDLNATQAAIRAGYSQSRASEIGYQQLQKTTVQKAISEAQDKRSERTQITQDDVLNGLLEVIAMSTGKKVVTETDVAKNENGELVGFDIAKTKFEPAAANKALELLGKHLGMFKDKVDLINSDGSLNRPMVIELIAPSLDDESTD
ncbi:terminase small subunit [Mannheimia pernigra]|uniref:terminase small subunit n=1 Tax=Mannheimia pernigra TaxID=111844 RepID=UPI00159F3546|nr:terminase small subunit [Mannheimia pernigra]QLB44405.1 terminase small subunit [Mannheimia pernigra]QLB44467.1 terminase small subunit [Mannheimia pernigra]